MYKANMSASRILRAPERFFVALDPRSVGVSRGAFRRDLASLVFMADLLFIWGANACKEAENDVWL
jgi:hypothetical protein